MTEQQIKVWAKALRLKGRTIRENADSITVWPQYRDQTPDGGPITFTTVVELKDWTNAHPYSQVSVLGGGGATR